MRIKNNVPIELNNIPFSNKDIFISNISNLLNENNAHCISYFAVKHQNIYKLYCAVANDNSRDIAINTTEIGLFEEIQSLTPKHNHIHVFEREMHEQHGILFTGHPWLKPLRHPNNYSFLSIDNNQLHEVGVGPIHAGIIEPGHFRFICDGEKIHHLEIVLGYQHRGIENMMNGLPDLKKALLAETIAGDSAVSHALAYTSAIEGLSNVMPDNKLQLERSIALEMERMAVHIGDTSALCLDIAYQLGQVVCEALRTIVINTTQLWCGNRFAKGLIRTKGTNYPLNINMCNTIVQNLNETINRYKEMVERIVSLPSLLARFEDIGIVTNEQAMLAGLTGTSARASGLKRDIRCTHPFQYYTNINVPIITQSNGDILSRLKQRISEIEQSFNFIETFIEKLKHETSFNHVPTYNLNLKPENLCVSLTEGWRGEICHTVLTNSQGEISLYKIKDPSLHNWTGLALAVRKQDISDFPICNKSFNLSYCGFDL